ncbi:MULTISPECIES: hypothetical protein [unclassified Microcoleus]|uniref:hypothetical protein n=1 Tax=unclassified Microcoleus TaxID=2642155 RepID=UPI002FCF9F0E
MLDKILNLFSERTVSNLAIKLLLNLQTRGVIDCDSDSEEYEYLGLVIKLKSLDKKMNWCVYDRLKQGVAYNTETALANAKNWIDNLDPNDPTQFD